MNTQGTQSVNNKTAVFTFTYIQPCKHGEVQRSDLQSQLLTRICHGPIQFYRLIAKITRQWEIPIGDTNTLLFRDTCTRIGT
jgi:hypothetical protein